jgi:hypothetical protein
MNQPADERLAGEFESYPSETILSGRQFHKQNRRRKSRLQNIICRKYNYALVHPFVNI